MPTTRREALIQLAALLAVPLPRLRFAPTDPLDGTIADYQAGRRRGAWTAAEVTANAVARCRSDGARWRAIDELSDTALAEARAADNRLRAGQTRGPLDGVPVFAKAIYDMNGLPTTGSSAEWARLFPELVRRDALEVARLRAAGAIVLGTLPTMAMARAATPGRFSIRTIRRARARRAARAPARRSRWPTGWRSPR
jgi:Asp-tRNA(Asn)/Glu-tRNA(Gln) amidotransferase A subunit family amidase